MGDAVVVGLVVGVPVGVAVGAPVAVAVVVAVLVAAPVAVAVAVLVLVVNSQQCTLTHRDSLEVITLSRIELVGMPSAAVQRSRDTTTPSARNVAISSSE